jgi:putative phosphoesterase
MRILIISDIHSNWVALEEVIRTEKFDACLCPGDLVDYGCEPAPVVDWVREHAAACVRGNHDHAVAEKILPKEGGTGMRQLAYATRPLHWEQLSQDQITWLRDLPTMQFIELDGVRFFLVHGTPRDPLEEYLGPRKEGWEVRLNSIDADYVCVGHTHLPFVLPLKGKTVINPGSVGQPRNLDPRASYAIYDKGRVTLKQIEYPIEKAIERYREAGISEQNCELAAEVLMNGGLMAAS